MRVHPTARRLWLRVEESPFQVAIAVLGAGIAAANLIGRHEALGLFAWLWYIALLIGGVVTLAGYLTEELSLESAGLCLLLGGYAFSTLRRIARAVDAVDVTAASVSFGAIAFGLAIRLIVVRKAFRARQHAARRVQRWRG